LLHTGNSRVSLSLKADLRAGLSEAKSDKNREIRQNARMFSRYATKIEGILPIWLILAGEGNREGAEGKQGKVPRPLKALRASSELGSVFGKIDPGFVFADLILLTCHERGTRLAHSCACGLYESFRQPRGKP